MYWGTYPIVSQAPETQHHKILWATVRTRRWLPWPCQSWSLLINGLTKCPEDVTVGVGIYGFGWAYASIFRIRIRICRALLAACFFLVTCLAHSWALKWRQHVSLKRRWLSTGLRRVMFQRMAVVMATALSLSNPAYCEYILNTTRKRNRNVLTFNRRKNVN
jgi:hypothetical protein